LLPAARKLFWKPQRFPIADAHYAMGFADLAEILGTGNYYDRAVHFLDVLEQTRCRDYEDYCWGYPFNWETRTGCVSEGTPLITTIPYVYEAFSRVHRIDNDDKWRRILRSVAGHVLSAYRDIATSQLGSSCTYTPAPDDRGGVVNASAYRAFLLTQAALDFADQQYLEVGTRNLMFVLEAQKADGSWPYSTDNDRGFVDHFHTCFILKALSKIERLTGCSRCTDAIERGVEYYMDRLFDTKGLPIPFSKAPRLTVYRRELYDYAECINLGVLLAGRFPKLDALLANVVADLLRRWQKDDGSFRTRELYVGWDEVPMHRWAQAQVFRSLTSLLRRSRVSPSDPCMQRT